jgi:hypothetical protein
MGSLILFLWSIPIFGHFDGNASMARAKEMFHERTDLPRYRRTADETPSSTPAAAAINRAAGRRYFCRRRSGNRYFGRR